MDIRPALTALVVTAGLLMPGSARARPWKGITPGKTTRAEVQQRFGKPSRALDNQGKCVAFLVYGGEQKIPGATQAQFCFDAAAKVVELRVFPDVKLEQDTVREAFGDDYRKKLTDDFLTYWHYERDGMVVFFEKDGKSVSAILYVEAKPSRRRAPAAGSAAADPGD